MTVVQVLSSVRACVVVGVSRKMGGKQQREERVRNEDSWRLKDKG